MLPGIPGSARCVQRFDDSLNSAIHITYHISLRSSSMREPRDPLLKVFLILFYLHTMGYMKNIDLKMQRKPAGAGNPPDRVTSESQFKSTRGAQVER